MEGGQKTFTDNKRWVALFFFTDPSQILKINSFSHGEHNDGTLNEKEIKEKILKNEDIFNRGTN